MALKSISQVSNDFGISARTLRYYDQIGLLESERKDDCAYRVYNQDSIIRLHQIIVLRKLRIPIKQIKVILTSHELVTAIEIFRQNVGGISREIDALSAIRSILYTLINKLQENAKIQIGLDLLDDKSILDVVNTLSMTKIDFKEETSMDELNKANEMLSQLKDVRIVYLPPATVAASHYIGENPENNANKPLSEFIKNTGLCRIKPDLRHYGFNHPNPSADRPFYGYEMWVTIPDDMDVPAPLVKKRYEGGLYAAHMIPMGNFNEWEWLCKWVMNNPDYESNALEDNGECMHGLLEECLNYINYSNFQEDSKVQLDLLYPIRKRN